MPSGMVKSCVCAQVWRMVPLFMMALTSLLQVTRTRRVVMKSTCQEVYNENSNPPCGENTSTYLQNSKVSEESVALWHESP